MYGGTLPPEFYLSSAPFSLHSLRGRVRLRFICNAFSMPLDTSIAQIQGFLSRNPSIISYLTFNDVPNPDLLFRGDSQGCELKIEGRGCRKYNRRLLRAIGQLDWVDETVRWVVELSGTGSLADRETLSTLHKERQNKILPNVYSKMLEQSTRPRSVKRWEKSVVARMRKDRPNSLLRNAVMPEDVVEEIL
ncbi:hypothetical protein V8C37DRAFT_392864 [Trichoderma ceciliae]